MGKKYLEKEFNKIIFFGAGNIAQAIMLGLLDAKTPSTKLLAINKNPMHDVFLRKHAIKKIFPKDLGKLNHPNNVLLLAVKPKDINIAVDQLRFSGYEGTVCSLAAGVSLRKISQLLGSDSVVRAMPTTASAFGLGTTGIYSDKARGQKTKLIKKLFDKIGVTLVLKNEKDMHDFTAVVGSGQAFLMQLLKEYERGLASLADQKKNKAIIKNLLRSLFLQFEMYGFEKAIKKIASKKGTTEAGLVTLHKLGGNKMLNETFKASKIRSQEIENEFK